MFLLPSNVDFFIDNEIEHIFAPNSKPVRPYGGQWRKMNRLFLKSMRRIIGAHPSAMGVAVLVRIGVMPLHYMFAYRACLWFLKIVSEESDPLLTDQCDMISADDKLMEHTSFFKNCKLIFNLSWGRVTGNRS